MSINFQKYIIKPVNLMMLFCMLLILLGSSAAWAQNNIVSGTVTDAQTDDPLVGVNILVIGTSIGTVMDTNGHYSVDVPSLQDTLRFSFIGYKIQKIPINDRTTITINVELKTTVVSN
jgi:hypothetical protein